MTVRIAWLVVVMRLMAAVGAGAWVTVATIPPHSAGMDGLAYGVAVFLGLVCLMPLPKP